MLTLDPILPEYPSDQFSQATWAKLSELASEGHGFYKHPNLSLHGTASFPDFVVLARNLNPLVVHIVRHDLNDIMSVDGDVWVLTQGPIPNPQYHLEDLVEGLTQLLNRERKLRNIVKPQGALSLPLISKAEFIAKFPHWEEGSTLIIWADQITNADSLLPDRELEANAYSLILSILQTVHAISPVNNAIITQPITKIGDAVKQLNNSIKLLDAVQQKAALNIPPGPQCIRGLAGTGKTVLLAMKAVSIHSHYRDKRILFTFNTQSLYNQIRALITRIYRLNHSEDPNWDLLQIRHGWGSKRRAGVYYDLCLRQGKPSLTLSDARNFDPQIPFRACCISALKTEIEPYYDFILVDEAQDFPREYFEVLWKSAKPPHCIYYAYDELQSLSSSEMPSPRELFGLNEDGTERFTGEGEYPGPIDKILTLTKSYRCPLDALMLAHGIGLGIHGPRGPIQMLERQSSWESLGYDASGNTFVAGSSIEVIRPVENSPNLIAEVYKGTRTFIEVQSFDNRPDELRSVARSIVKDIREENVLPHDIVVISLDSLGAKGLMSQLQVFLSQAGVRSTIPGLVNDTAEFAEEGFVTLSTVYRAKGNEAPVVYIVAFEKLLDYVDEIPLRNRAFTSLSRTKGWVSISGVAPEMDRVRLEIDKIRSDLPSFRFIFPDMSQIKRRLDPSETTKRKLEVTRARKSVQQIVDSDLDALVASVSAADLAKIEEKLKQAKKRLQGETE